MTSTPQSVAGGSGTYVGIRQLARALEERDVRVEMHAPGWWSPSFTVKRLLFNLLAAPRLRRRQYDWVVGFDLDGFHYGRAKRAPYIASIKGVIADELRNERGVARALLGVQAAFERVAVHRADVVVSTSRYSRDRIVEAYGVPAAKVVIVPELIDLQAWAEESIPPPGTQADPPAILTVAHMYPRKNLGLLVKAYAHLRDAGIPFQGWIVGDGPCRRAWERQRDRLGLQASVTFLGSISRRELQERYRRARIFCLPSRQEGFGIVFLEAMACRKPIVAARAAAVPETVTEGVAGLLVDPEDVEALVEVLAALLSDPDRCRAMGEAGRRRVEQYGADRVASSFLTTVHAALDGLPDHPRLPRMPAGVSRSLGGHAVASFPEGGRQ
ncbi:MAG: glycosyltransferase family 4 protein [candidate division NC10 bacterium]|nr:glycosyltransferase family 4 protein [candidate division NC10 bacterium]